MPDRVRYPQARYVLTLAGGWDHPHARAVLGLLGSGEPGGQIRLEQERIRFRYARRALKRSA